MKLSQNKSVALFIAFEVNFMDDVGQTLLNWASAFGTQEMVKKKQKTNTYLLFHFQAIFLSETLAFSGMNHIMTSTTQDLCQLLLCQSDL